MERINVAWMYPNLLNLHGERGSVQMLTEVGTQLGIDVRITRIEDFDDPVTFADYDLLMFLPGEISIFPYLIPAMQAIGDYVENGGYVLALGTTGLMFGKSILREDGTEQTGLGLLDMTATERKFVHGDDLHFRISGSDTELAGSQIQMADVDAKEPLGTTIYGMGNNNTGAEGARYRNLIYTNCLGPLFVKNPWFAESILKDILKNKGVEITKSGSYPIAENSFKATLDFISAKENGLLT